MNQFHPVFPPSVSGKGYCPLLNHPEVEAIGKRMDRLYCGGRLTDDERRHLLMFYRSVVSADRYFSNTLGERPLPATAIRPRHLDDARRLSSDCFGQTDLEVRAGFVWGVLEYIERLELRHFGVEVDADAI